MFQIILIAFIFMNIKNGQTVPHRQSGTTTAATVQITYDNKFDNVDLDEILGQERLLKNYVKCLEGTGPCTPDGRMLKETLPDAIASDCEKCTEKQKYGSEKVTHTLIDDHPLEWERLEKIYDPKGTYRLNYLASKKQNINMTTTVAPTTITAAIMTTTTNINKNMMETEN